MRRALKAQLSRLLVWARSCAVPAEDPNKLPDAISRLVTERPQLLPLTEAELLMLRRRLERVGEQTLDQLELELLMHRSVRDRTPGAHAAWLACAQRISVQDDD